MAGEEVDVLFMFGLQNIAAKLRVGSTLLQLFETFLGLFGQECEALQFYDKDWEEWVNLPAEFTLSHRLKLKAVVQAKSKENKCMPTGGSAKKQSVLSTSSGSVCVYKKNVLETKPPYHSFLIPNPHSERLKYYNDITPVLFKETAGEFVNMERFQNYLIIHRRWMFETHKEVSSFTSFIEHLNSNENSGLSQNVRRYQSLPRDVCSGDLKRCENTIVSLEKKIQEGESLRKKIQDSKKSCFSSTSDVVPGGNNKLQYIEEKISIVDDTILQLKVMSGKANEVYRTLCNRFSQQSALKSDKGRQKRRQKEQKRKCAKKKRKSLEKNTTNLLSLILTSPPTSSFSALEAKSPIVTRLNLNVENLNLNILKPRFHLQPLKELLANGYVHDEVKNELQSLVEKLEKRSKEKKKMCPKKKLNHISKYFQRVQAAPVHDDDDSEGDDDDDNDNDNDDDDDDDDDDVG